MQAGDVLVVRGPGGICEALVTNVWRPPEGCDWTRALAHGVGITQYRVEPRDVVADGPGRWRLKWQEER